MGPQDAHAGRSRDDETATRPESGAERRSATDFAAGLQSAVGSLRDELRDQREAGLPAPVPAPRWRLAAPAPAPVLRLPLPQSDETLADDTPEITPDVVTSAIAPLVAEVVRLRAEIESLREPEVPPAPEPASRGGGELVRLLAGVVVCLILVAIALVIVVKA